MPDRHAAIMEAGVSVDAVDVTPVVSRRDREAFIRLPWRIYRDDPLWVAPLLAERRWFISEQHPFRRHGAAALFIARRGGEVIGRIMASDDPNQDAGCFGMFESVNDPAVAHALLDAAAGWLRGRGRLRGRGPVDYSTNYNCGLLVEGFDTPPRVMMNHNPPWYAGLLESWGLSKARDLYCWWGEAMTPEAREWATRIQELLPRDVVTIRTLDRRRWRNEMRLFKTVYHEAWQDNWGFVRMSDAELDAMARWLYWFGDSRLVLLAEACGKPVGFSIIFPDLFESLRAVPNGRLLPLGWWRLWCGRRRIKTVRYMILGVTPAYRNRGVGERLAVQSSLNVPEGKYTGMEMGWVLEENSRLYKSFERFGAKRYKTYRVYERGI